MKILLPVLASIAVPAVAFADVIVNDSGWSSPVNNSYVGASSGLNYFGSSGSSGNLSLTGESTDLLTLSTAGGGRGMSFNFAKQTLSSVGDSLSVSVTFQIGGAVFTSTSNNFRLALHDNSDGTAITANAYANTNDGFVGYEGYLLANSFDFADTTPTTILRKQTAANSIIASTTGFDTLGSGGTNINPDETPALAVGQSYTATITVTSIASGLNIAYALSGSGVGTIFDFDVDDTTPGTDAFTTLALHVNSNTWDTTELQNVTVAYSPVPEPAAFATFAGLGVIVLAATRRRRRC